MHWIRRNWKWTLPLGVAGLAVGIWLFFGWFGFHTLLFDRTVDEAAPTFTTAPTTTTTVIAASAGDDAGTTTSTVPAPTTTTVPPGPITVATGQFIDRSHPTSGTAVVIGDGAGRRVLRLEGFRTDNGPDLFVYLSTAPPDSPAGDFDEEFIDLGVLKGNIGDQNYEIPEGVDIDRFSTVVIWCRRFTVVFGAAPLEIAQPAG